MTRADILLRRVRWLTAFFIFGLVLSGATAIPLITELDWLLTMMREGSRLTEWIRLVRDALVETDAKYPFLAYGTDWLAFGHFVIAVAFLGPLRDPVRNVWIYSFGMIACVLVVPYALVFGALRGIPFYWRIIDCAFGILGILPVWYCRSAALELERLQTTESPLRLA